MHPESAKPLHIAFFLGSFPSISETFILNQITGLISRGHQVHIYSERLGNLSLFHPDFVTFNLIQRMRMQPRLPKGTVWRVLKGIGLLLSHGRKGKGVLFRSLSKRFGKHASSLKLLYSSIPLLPSTRYDIVQAHFGPQGERAVYLRDLGVIRGKVVTTFHGYDINVRPRRKEGNIYKRLFEAGDLFTANSQFTARKLKALGCPEGKIIEFPMGVDFAKLPQEKRLKREDRFRILTVARLVETKGIHFALEAIAHVVGKHPFVQYSIVGGGPQLARLQELSEQLQILSHVDFLGPQPWDKVLDLYRESDIFVLPSIVGEDGTEETQGLVLAEAQAMGLPVIGTNIGGIPESLKDGRSGFLIPQRDSRALASTIAFLIENPQIRVELGAEARKFAREKYDLNTLNDQLVGMYRNLTGSI